MEQVLTGKKFRKMQPEDVLSFIRRHDEPVVTASDVADALGGKRRLAHRRLKQLEEAGRLRSKKTGGRSKVWYLKCPEQ